MFNQDDTVNAISRIEACVAEIKSWMITNKLILNGDKTVIIVFSAPRHSVSCDVNRINIDGHDIVPAKTVKNLGVMFYDKLSLDSHIKNICKTSLFYLKNISNILFPIRLLSISACICFVSIGLLQFTAPRTAFLFHQTSTVHTKYCSTHPHEDSKI